MDRNEYEPRPDHYGTGREPYRKKPIFSLTVLLFALLIGANLTSFAFLMGYNVGKNQVESTHSPDTAGRATESTAPAAPSPADLAAELQKSLATVRIDGKDYVGIVLSENGYLLTTAPKAQPERVTLGAAHYDEIQIQGTAPELGLAVIKIDAQGLTPVSMGLCAIVDNSEEQLIRLPSPLSGGAAQWLSRMKQTQRELNGVRRSVLEGSYAADDLLLNAQGQLVGLCVTTAEGVVALPMEELLNLAVELMVFGHLDNSLAVGAELTLLDEAQSLYWNLPGNLMVGRIAEGSIAQAVGLREGDVLLQISGEEISGPADLWNAIAACKDSGIITLTVYRSNEELQLQLDLRN